MACRSWDLKIAYCLWLNFVSEKCWRQPWSYHRKINCFSKYVLIILVHIWKVSSKNVQFIWTFIKITVEEGGGCQPLVPLWILDGLSTLIMTTKSFTHLRYCFFEVNSSLLQLFLKVFLLDPRHLKIVLKLAQSFWYVLYFI